MGKKQRVLCVLLAVMLMASMLAGCSGKPISSAQATTGAVAKTQSNGIYKVTIDVNPSIELTVTDGIVTGAVAFNDDGTGIVLSANVIGMTADAAMKAVVTELVSGGYISSVAEIEPYLVITVSKNGVSDEDMTKKLKATAQQTLEELKLECRIGTADVTPEDIAAATTLNLSVGRYLMLKYIAAVEKITIEQAITTYGSMKIGELMDMFGGIEDLFQDEINGRGDFLEHLTPEQVQLVNGAIKVFKADLKKAEKAFHDTWKDLRENYSKQVKAIVKEKLDAAAIQAKLDALKQIMLTERATALGVLTAAVNAAKDKCIAAVSSVPLTANLFSLYLNEIAQKEIDKQEGFNEFVKGFTYHGKGNVQSNDHQNSENGKPDKDNGNKPDQD